MATERFLIEYLPPFMQEFREMDHIMSSEQKEVDDLWEACDDALSNQFVSSANEDGVKRWEKAMRITPKDTDTLDERKFRLLTAMNQDLPYTIRKLVEILTTICGVGNFSINLQNANYHIVVKLAVVNKNNYQQVVDLLTNTIPANMTQSVEILYNHHGLLAEFTHEELSAYTQEQLRNEVLSHG